MSETTNVAMEATATCPSFGVEQVHEIGQPNQPVFAMAFPGGAGDAVMQLGVIHALLVSQRKPPDAVAGISAGAFHAAALAEVLLEPTPEKQVARFREFLNATANAPREFQRSLFPDPYEIDAHAPLQSLELPIHSPKERELRTTAVLSMAGLIRLFNDILSVRLKISTATVVAHRWLALTAAGETPNPIARHYKRLWAFMPILFLAPLNLRKISRLSWQLLAALVWGSSLNHGLTAGDMISPLYRAMRWIKRKWQDAVGFLAGVVFWALLIVGLAVWEACYLVSLPMRLGWHVHGASPIAFRNPPRFINALTVILRLFLERYDLAREIGSSYTLEQFLIRLFDRNFYGELQMGSVVDAALDRRDATADRKRAVRKTFNMYKKNGASRASIHVAAVVGDVATGCVTTIPGTESVVKGLLAAMAVVPIFRPVEFSRNGKTIACIDAMNLANEPVYALLDYMRDRIHKEASVVYLYPVAAFPADKPELNDPESGTSDLVDVVMRVMALRRFQGATLERKLMKLYTRILPSGKAKHEVPGWSRSHISAHSIPIEPEYPLRVNERIAAETQQDKKARVIYETVAQGCRLTLEALVKPDLTEEKIKSCREALKTLPGYRDEALPGSDTSRGPGVSEVCKVCTLHQKVTENGKVTEKPHEYSLRVKKSDPQDGVRPEWPPLKAQDSAPKPSVPSEGSEPSGKSGSDENKTPKTETKPGGASVPADNQSPDPEKPWVCLLLSGGVFRGVFQVGVLNALNQAEVQPTIFAGSSVGSIMAAMAVKCFKTNKNSLLRQREITDLAATFLGLDRLILTDRFADFVRRFTIRAGATEFSPRDTDVLFRRYDALDFEKFGDDARRVIAGLERLFYINPFDLKEIVRAIRHEEMLDAFRRIKGAVQNFLERNNVGLEILGAEPLELVVAQHVLKGEASPHKIGFDEFLGPKTQDRLYLLATVSDLTKGRLCIVGREAASQKDVEAVLLPALLASSAFPAVFRPRHSSEIFPTKNEDSIYVDGGVMDNLPLGAVTQFLDDAAKAGLVARRPAGGTIPHLLLTASLEPLCRELSQAELREMCASWPLLRKRIGQLSYNRKVDAFAETQQHFREIVNSSAKAGWLPVDMEVVTVKPHWLCKTFGFHPMLGFRRRRQAASIAHGCASTLARLHVFKQDYMAKAQEERNENREDDAKKYESAWNISGNLMDPKTIGIVKDKKNGKLLDIILTPKAEVRQGTCWFRPGKQCPFSREGLQASGIGRTSRRYRELQMIYQLCGQPDTHAQL